MIRPLLPVLLAAVLPSTAVLPSAPALQAQEAGTERVRQAFLHAWNGYREHAWGHDDLNPLSATPHDWHDVSLLMTPVDAYDTMLLMGLDDEAAEAKALILDELSFDHDISVQVFEITIRILGGLLSAYQMDGDSAFLALAEDLGRRLLPAFETPTGMPYRYVNLVTGDIRDSINNPAEIGTLMLEFGTLSRLTGDPVFYDTAKRGMAEVFQRRSDVGLVGETINVVTGEWENTASHVSGRIDSWYEYLLKAWRLFGDEDFRDMWEASMAAVNEHLAEERDGALWYGHAEMETGERTYTWFGALDAFLPAVLVLGGDTARAKRLMESVYSMWTTWDVEPELMDYADMRTVSAGYELRPESIESAYYLYWFTGDERYRAMGGTMFEAIELFCRTDAGYAALEDVRTKEQKDRMHSFLLAETFKYAWLLFAPRETLDLETVVFNTEAHPLRRTW